MKKIVSLILILSIIIIACSRKIVATKETPAANNNSTITQTETTKSNTDVANAALIAQGKTVFETKCGKCHNLKRTIDYTADRWDGILKQMAPKAKLTQEETEQVAAYVKSNSKM
jgi:cytochrome c5